MKHYSDEDETIYGCCTGCDGMVPINELWVHPEAKRFYSTYLLKAERGENPKAPDDLCMEVLCKKCKYKWIAQHLFK